MNGGWLLGARHPTQPRVVSSRDDKALDSEGYSRVWLVLIGLTRLCLVSAPVALEYADTGSPWSGLALELGAGFLLFGVLFWFAQLAGRIEPPSRRLDERNIPPR
jgi:hypothetical protein